jgi:hypothetical protein
MSLIDEQRIERMDILDLTVTNETTRDGRWWHVTLAESPDPGREHRDN